MVNLPVSKHPINVVTLSQDHSFCGITVRSNYMNAVRGGETYDS